MSEKRAEKGISAGPVSPGRSWVAVAAALAFVGTAEAGSVEPPAAAELAVLDELLAGYASLGSVRLHATATVEGLVGNRTVSIRGEIDHWESGDRYRTRCRTEGGAGIVIDDVDLAFDGLIFRWYRPRLGILTTFTGDREFPTALPNPLFLPVAALLEREVGCEFCRSRLADAPASRVGLPSKLRGSQVRAGGTIVVAVDASPDSRGAYEARIIFAERSGTMRPIAIERLAGDRVELLLELDEWLDVEGRELALPRRISILHLAENGSVLQRLEYRIDRLEAGIELPPAVFEPEVLAETVVIDSELPLYPACVPTSQRAGAMEEEAAP